MAAETALTVWGELVRGALALDLDTFARAARMEGRLTGALLVVFLAGISRGLGQAIVLAANRVKPLRFLLSVAIGALLFAAGYLFWSACTWLVAWGLFDAPVTYRAIAMTLGYAYAPFLFGFAVALPYLGAPLSNVLSVWALLAVVVGLRALTGLDEWAAFVCAALGSIVEQGLQRTIGRPAAALGQWLSNRAAGVELVTNLQDLERAIEQSFQQRIDRAMSEEMSEAKMSEAKTSEAKMPEAKMPEAKMPEAKMPEAKMPEEKMPEENSGDRQS